MRRARAGVIGLAAVLAVGSACGLGADPASPASPDIQAPPEPELVVPEATPEPVPRAEVAVKPAVEVSEDSGLVFVALDPDAGPLRTQLVDQAQLARAQGRVPFVELYGDWCEPCRLLRESLSDPRMQAAFAGTYVVLVDTSKFEVPLQDRSWGGGQDSYAVPAFYVLQEDGTAGASIDGNAWGPNVPEEMAPPLRAFFTAHGVTP